MSAHHSVRNAIGELDFDGRVGRDGLHAVLGLDAQRKRLLAASRAGLEG